MDANTKNLISRIPDTFRYLPKSLFIKNVTKYLGGGFTKNDDVVDLYEDVIEDAIANSSVVDAALETLLVDKIGSDAETQAAIDTYVEAADLDITGDWSFAGSTVVSEDLAFTETVANPATSSTMTLVQKQLVHTVEQGATEVLPIDVPDDALIVSAEILVSTALAFTTGTAVTATWTNSTQQIGGTDALAAKNSKVSAFYDANAESAIATGTPETITLTADAGTVDSGEVVVIVRYWTLSGIADVA